MIFSSRDTFLCQWTASWIWLWGRAPAWLCFEASPGKSTKYLSVQIIFCSFYLVGRICLAKLPVKKLNTLLQLVDLNQEYLTTPTVPKQFYLLDKSVIWRISAQLHVRSVSPGLKPWLSNLQQFMIQQWNTKYGSSFNLEWRLFVPEGLPEALDVLLLVVDLLHGLAQVGLELVVRVCGLLRQFTKCVSLLFPFSQAVHRLIFCHLISAETTNFVSN